jgi:hypothetical protein
MHRSLIRADAAPARPKPDRGDEANIFVQHLRREIFSDGQFGDWSAKFGRDFKGKFCQPDRQFESYLVRQLICICLQGFVLDELAQSEIGLAAECNRGGRELQRRRTAESRKASDPCLAY